MERQSLPKAGESSHGSRLAKSRSVAPAQHPVAALQQSIGIQAIQRLINSHYIQAKLHVGPPNDQYEQEADRVAETVMRMADPQGGSAVVASTPISRVNRKCLECEAEEERMVQGKVEPGDQLEVSRGADNARIVN